MDVEKFAKSNGLKYRTLDRKFDLYKLSLYSIPEYKNCLLDRTKGFPSSKVLKPYLEVSFLCLCTDEKFFDYGVPINECVVRILKFSYPDKSVSKGVSGIHMSVTVNTIDDGPLLWDHKCSDIKEAEYLAKEFIISCTKGNSTILVVNIQKFMDKFGFDESELIIG